MNWQIIVGFFFLIGGIGNIAEDFSVFFTAFVISVVLLFFGFRKKSNAIKKNQSIFAIVLPPI